MMKSSIVKLISQYLINENLSEVSDTLAKESKISLEPPLIKTLKQYIQAKQYDKSIVHILPYLSEEEKEAIIPQIRLYQILEMVSSLDIPSNKKKIKILKFIRKIQKNSYDKANLLPQCAAMVFGINSENLLPIIPIYATSQSELFTYLDNILSKSSNKLIQTVQSNQLEAGLIDISKKNINSCLYHNCFDEDITLMKGHNCSNSLVPTKKSLTIELHNEEVIYIAMSNSHTKIAVLCKTNMIYLYSLSLNNKELEISFVKVLAIHFLQITSLMWNYNDTLLISSSQDKTVKIFTETGEVKNKLDYNEMVSFCYILPNNKVVISTLESLVYLYNLNNSSNELIMPHAIINEICWSEAMTSLIFSCCSLKEVIIYSDDLQLEKKRLKINDTIISISLSTHDKGIYLIVNSSNKTPIIWLYDLRNGELIRKFLGHRQNNLINKCRFGGAKDNFIIAGGNKKICIWNINQTIPIYELDFNSGNVNDLIWPAVSPYNSFMFSVSSDNSITFISNNSLTKFLYLTAVNSNQSKLDDNNNNCNSNHSIHSNQSNHNNANDRFNRYLYINLFRGGDNVEDEEDDEEDEDSFTNSMNDSH